MDRNGCDFIRFGPFECIKTGYPIKMDTLFLHVSLFKKSEFFCNRQQFLSGRNIKFTIDIFVMKF